MAKYKVLYTDTGKDDYSIEAEVLKKIDAEVIMSPSMDEETIIELGKDCDGAMILYADVNKRVLDAWGKAGRMKAVSRQGIGYDNIDVKAATENKIMVGNVPDYCFTEVADHAMALVLALLRQLKSFDHRVKDGEWSENPIWAINRFGTMKFGLVGVGGIAKKVASRAQAFDFEVLAFDPFQSSDELAKLGIKKVETIDALAEQADVISVHAPSLESTKHMINYELMKKMKPTTIIVNTSRGSLINLTDLVRALDEGLISGAGLDVVENEPLEIELCKTLGSKDNVILTSHVGFYSQQSDDELRMRIAENIALALTEGEPRSYVNKQAMLELHGKE